MTEQEEEYIHLVSCVEDLNKAWVILQEIKNSKEMSGFVGLAFEFALVIYSRPYTISHGEIRNRKLNNAHIPINYQYLHERIVKARNQIHAHSDLTIKEAKLYIKNTQQGKIVSQLQNKIAPTQEFPNIDKIIDLIEQTLDSLYIEEKRLEQQLLANL